ncbi:TauD/TfdA family dioxygenase [Breoghania sp. JC706]|uniref:TauD/TfdA family dioxygenase n=1 Tax=Breoghania sp. JC706 TaxID=3117732 RepID=UPI00300BCB25
MFIFPTVDQSQSTPIETAPDRKCDGQCKGQCKCALPSVDMADLRRYRFDIPLTRVTRISDEAIRVTWKDGEEDDFHFAWLRDNDPHPTSRHRHSRERLVRLLDVSCDIRPAEVSIQDDGALLIRWSQTDCDHQSAFDAGWLRAHRYGHVIRNGSRSAARMPSRPRPIEVDWNAVMNDDDALFSWLEGYLTRGWSIISGVPDEKGPAVAFGQRIGTVRSSNFGFCFDVRSKAAPISNAYTAHYLPLHTDLPHYELPPGLQILHCLANEAEGGASLMADGLAVAHLLRRTEPDVFARLSGTPVAFRFQDAESEFNARHPIIECDGAGNPVHVNWSNSTLAPLDAPFEDMPALRAAIQRFVALIESPRFLIERKLEAGEMLVFDNRRMLHGRTAFKPETGARHFQGCYLDTAEVLSRRNALARRDPFLRFV